MDFLVLTKSGGLFGFIAEGLGWIMEGLFAFTGTFGVVNIGLCILLFTLVTRLLLFPLSVKQQKSSKIMAIMQPEIQAIQKKYQGKTDRESQMKMSVETREVYEKYGTSMSSGCLPLLIQLPIMLALYRVIYQIPAYVKTVRNYFDLVIEKLPAGFENNAVFVRLTETHNLAGADYTNMDKVVDLLYKLTNKQWGEMIQEFPEIANAVTATGENVIEGINNMQQFVGINIAYTPWNVITEFFGGASDISVGVMIAAFMIPILSGATQWLSTKMISSGQPEQAQGSEMMKSMNVTMPLMSVFFCFTFPLGIGIYWVASSVFQLIQQMGMNAYFKNIDIDELVKKNVEKANKKRAKKGLAPAKVNTNATQTLKNIQAAQEKEAQEKAAKMEKSQKLAAESTAYYNQNAKPGSLMAKAGMVQKYNEKVEKKSK